LPGNWDVTLVATGTGGTTTLTQKYLITTYPKPILDFYTNKRFMSLPNAVFNFINNSNTVKNDWSLIDSLGQVQQQSKLRDPSFVVNQTARFGVQLIGTNSYGCVDTLFKPNYISTTGPGYVYVPNAFSPNKNGRNDGFAPSLFNIKERNYMFRVYNRWGEMVYETTDINGIWDGYYKGNFCEQDVYVWTVNGEYFNGDLFSFRGTVTLLR
jgi:gliding motility-associated-like protein